MLTAMLYGMATAAVAVPVTPPASTVNGASFEQAAAKPAAVAASEAAETRRVAEPGTAATLALGLSLLGLARRRLPTEPR